MEFRRGTIDTASRSHVGRSAAALPSRTSRRWRTSWFGLALTIALVVVGASSSTAFAVLHPKVSATFSCDSVTFHYAGFANANGNEVNEAIKVDGVVVARRYFVFNGPTATDTLTITPLSGTHEVQATTHWHTNETTGEHDGMRATLTCEPAYTIEKLQQIEGGNAPFTTSPLTGKSGQIVDYEIVVKNTGNAPLTFSSLSDPKCIDIAGGPGATPLGIGETTTYTCDQPLGDAGEYANTATATGTPPGGAPITHTSNTVVVAVPPEPEYTIEKLQQIENTAEPFTTSTLSAGVGQTVDYEIVVRNTGNTPLTFSSFSDEKCTNIAGGPGANPLAPGESTTYTCSHVLTTVGEYTNAATVSGTSEGGVPITHTSNTVVVDTKLLHPKVKNTFTCSSVTFTFAGFPNANGNEINEAVKVDGVLVTRFYFTFNGPSGSNTIFFQPPLTGKHEIQATAHWHSNGNRGEHDGPLVAVDCEQ